MAKAKIQKVRYKSVDALEVQNDNLILTILPKWGGNIIKLKHKGSGKDWMWRNPYLRNLTHYPGYSDPYINYTIGGFDECFPSIASCYYPEKPWKGISIPDHGEIWGRPFQTKQCKVNEEGKAIIDFFRHGVRFPYHFSRSLVLSPKKSEFVLYYEVLNPTSFPFYFLWSAHPLIEITEGMNIDLPEGLPFRIDYSSNQDLGTPGTQHNWPSVQVNKETTIELNRLKFEDSGRVNKLFFRTEDFSSPYIDLLDVKFGQRLRLSFSEAVTHFGLWINYGGWNPSKEKVFHHVGLEPCIGAPDVLSIAVNNWREYGIIPPKKSLSWEIKFQIIESEE